jgi:hypothetical protein
MRCSIPLAVVALFAVLAPQACASGPDSKFPDPQSLSQQSIDALADKAEHAQPRDRCFLYAELVHRMTEVSVRQYAAGDVEKASLLLREVQQLAHRIHVSVSDDNKRLKSAEIQLRLAAFRLSDMLHTSSFEDRPLVEQTLAQVNEAQTQTMMQVFRR